MRREACRSFPIDSLGLLAWVNYQLECVCPVQNSTSLCIKLPRDLKDISGQRGDRFLRIKAYDGTGHSSEDWLIDGLPELQKQSNQVEIGRTAIQLVWANLDSAQQGHQFSTLWWGLKVGRTLLTRSINLWQVESPKIVILRRSPGLYRNPSRIERPQCQQRYLWLRCNSRGTELKAPRAKIVKLTAGWHSEDYWIRCQRDTWDILAYFLATSPSSSDVSSQMPWSFLESWSFAEGYSCTCVSSWLWKRRLAAKGDEILLRRRKIEFDCTKVSVVEHFVGVLSCQSHSPSSSPQEHHLYNNSDQESMYSTFPFSRPSINIIQALYMYIHLQSTCTHKTPDATQRKKRLIYGRQVQYRNLCPPRGPALYNCNCVRQNIPKFPLPLATPRNTQSAYQVIKTEK